MECPNPRCGCEECACARPCTCGLVLTALETTEEWDSGLNQLLWTESRVYGIPEPSPQHQGIPPHAADSESMEPDQGGELAAALSGEASPATSAAAARAKYEREQAHQVEHVNGEAHSSVRTAVHNGHSIVIETTYRVAIGGKPLGAHFGVSDSGSVHYHGLPNHAYSSALELARAVVDAFPDDFPPDGTD